MRFLATTLSALAAVCTLPSLVQGTALTTTLEANERSCYYADVDGAGEKIGFYFAVQSGGDFDIDFSVTDPDDVSMLEGNNEKQGDYIFTANKVGEYSFCFENEASLSDKLIDFDIMVESEPRRALPAQSTPLKEHTSSLEESTYKLNGLLSNIIRTQKYFHTRNHRNHSTVESTQSRIFWFSVIECVAVVGMSLFGFSRRSSLGQDGDRRYDETRFTTSRMHALNERYM